MATTKSGNKGALLVIDVQKGVVENAWKRDEIVGNIATLVDRARNDGVDVVWIQHESEDEMPPESPQWQIVDELVPVDGETRLRKRYSDSFADTELESTLDDLSIGRVVICGAQTNACVRSTCYGAMVRGYDVTLIEDAHTSDDIIFEDQSGKAYDVRAESMIDDLNLTLSFLEYPGVTLSAVPHTEVM